MGGVRALLPEPRPCSVPRSEGGGLVGWEEEKLREDPGEDRIWLVAERAGHLVGYIVASVWHPQEEADREIMRELGETTLRVHALMVTEDERRKGVGRALMKAAEDRGRDKGASMAMVIGYAHSPTSVPFYEEGLGYERTTIGYTKDL